MLQLSSVMTVAHPRAPAAMTSAKAARVQPNIRLLSRCTRQPMTTAANTKMPRSTAVKPVGVLQDHVTCERGNPLPIAERPIIGACEAGIGSPDEAAQCDLSEGGHQCGRQHDSKDQLPGVDRPVQMRLGRRDVAPQARLMWGKASESAEFHNLTIANGTAKAISEPRRIAIAAVRQA